MNHNNPPCVLFDSLLTSCGTKIKPRGKRIHEGHKDKFGDYVRIGILILIPSELTGLGLVPKIATFTASYISQKYFFKIL